MTTFVFTQKAHCRRCKKWLDWYTHNGTDKCDKCVEIEMGEFWDNILKNIFKNESKIDNAARTDRN